MDIHQQLSLAAYEPLKKRVIDGYMRDPQLSNANYTTYYNPHKNHTVIAYRGTAAKEDLLPDLDIARGSRQHQRFQEAVAHARKVQDKYTRAKITTTGHSLGGTQALYVNDQLGLPAQVYNPGGALKESQLKNKNVKIIRNKGDLVSAGYAGQPQVETRSTNTSLKDYLGTPLGILPGIIGWQLDQHSADPQLQTRFKNIFGSLRYNKLFK